MKDILVAEAAYLQEAIGIRAVEKHFRASECHLLTGTVWEDSTAVLDGAR